MRLSLVLMLCGLVAVSQAQLSVGPNGVSTTPINLVTVFKFLRSIWNSYFYPEPIETLAKQDENTIDREGKRIDETNTKNKHQVVIEKFDSNCTDDGKCDPPALPAETKLFTAISDATEEGESNVANTQQQTAQLVVSKWSLIYVVIISMLFWPLLVLATPYFFTGVPLRRDDSSNNFGYDYFNSDDVLLLLSWVLGEISDDHTCLEAVVCRSAPRSSQYITLTSVVMNIAKFLKGWGIPYSKRIDNTLRRLGSVAQTGLHEGCGNYYCENLPNSFDQYYDYDANYVDDGFLSEST